MNGDEDPGRPILLYDGVCNLCDAAVQFVLQRDREQRFVFAALQSDAAERTLEEAGAPDDLPDSMVVVDERGVHMRSDAALAVARRLEWPWRLLSVAYLVPRFVRDPLYSWIARNRYRWFGRQTVCRVPTPDVRARFLDAEEPPRDPIPTTLTSQDAQVATGLGLGTLPGRFLLVYPLVFMLPFPLTLGWLLGVVPGFNDSALATALGWLSGLHARVMQPLVAALGGWLTGETPSFEFTGSGDGIASYLDVLVDLGIAALIALIWWLWRRAKPITPLVADVSRVLLRYYLISIMLSYGFAKVFPLQFASPGPDRLMQPYGDSSPMGLLWTFMGASAGYQMFGGAAEVLGGLLLMFRRTTLLGSLVVVAVMTNVFAMNVFFDVPVKLYSFHYLAFAVVLAVPDLPRLVGLFLANVPVAARDLRPRWFDSRRGRWAIGSAKVALLGLMLGTNIDSSVDRMRSSGPWAPIHELRGIYRVESFELADGEMAPEADVEAEVEAEVADDLRWVRLGLRPPWSATVQYANGRAQRMRLSLDDEASTVTLYDRSLTEPPDTPLALERLEGGRLRFVGVFEERPIRVTLRPDESESLLTSRGFHWINEYPFNR